MTRLKKVLAALIAVVFAALSCLPGVLVLAENAQANTLSILLLYDDSYEQTLRRQGYSIDDKLANSASCLLHASIIFALTLLLKIIRQL